MNAVMFKLKPGSELWGMISPHSVLFSIDALRKSRVGYNNLRHHGGIVSVVSPADIDGVHLLSGGLDGYTFYRYPVQRSFQYTLADTTIERLDDRLENSIASALLLVRSELMNKIGEHIDRSILPTCSIPLSQLDEVLYRYIERKMHLAPGYEYLSSLAIFVSPRIAAYLVSTSSPVGSDGHATRFVPNWYTDEMELAHHPSATTSSQLCGKYAGVPVYIARSLGGEGGSDESLVSLIDTGCLLYDDKNSNVSISVSYDRETQTYQLRSRLHFPVAYLSLSPLPPVARPLDS